MLTIGIVITSGGVTCHKIIIYFGFKTVSNFILFIKNIYLSHIIRICHKIFKILNSGNTGKEEELERTV